MSLQAAGCGVATPRLPRAALRLVILTVVGVDVAVGGTAMAVAVGVRVEVGDGAPGTRVEVADGAPDTGVAVANATGPPPTRVGQSPQASVTVSGTVAVAPAVACRT